MLKVYVKFLLKIDNGPNGPWLTTHALEWINRTCFAVDDGADLRSAWDTSYYWSATGVVEVGVVADGAPR